MQWTGAAQVFCFYFLQVGNDLGVAAGQCDLQIELEGADVHVARANHCDIVIDANRFRVQYHRSLSSRSK